MIAALHITTNALAHGAIVCLAVLGLLMAAIVVERRRRRCGS